MALIPFRTSKIIYGEFMSTVCNLISLNKYSCSLIHAILSLRHFQEKMGKKRLVSRSRDIHQKICYEGWFRKDTFFYPYVLRILNSMHLWMLLQSNVYNTLRGVIFKCLAMQKERSLITSTHTVTETRQNV